MLDYDDPWVCWCAGLFADVLKICSPMATKIAIPAILVAMAQQGWYTLCLLLWCVFWDARSIARQGPEKEDNEYALDKFRFNDRYSMEACQGL